MPQTTNFKINGVEIGTALDLLDKEYVIENYPEINNVFKQAGLWVWGFNSTGQLGDNTTVNKSSPIQTISSGTNWKLVGKSFTNNMAAIKTDGTLWTWGIGTSGELGDNTSVSKSSPVQTVSGGTNWKFVAGGRNHQLAIKTDETLWVWGLNTSGQLGDNTSTSRSSPVQIVSSTSTWKTVSGGAFFSAGVKIDGSLWLWGSNSYGQLGNNANGNTSDTTNAQSSPVQTVSGGTNWLSVACGYDHVAAIKTDGTLWLWGSNFNGQLGDNTTTNRSSPVQTISGGTNWRQVSGSSATSASLTSRFTAAIKTDGTLWLWGDNPNGNLGNDTIGNSYSSPIQTVSGGTNWKQVNCSSFNTAAIKTDGTLWIWGINNQGHLGDNTGTRKSSPVQTVAGGTNWKYIGGGSQNTLAIRDDSMDQL